MTTKRFGLIWYEKINNQGVRRVRFFSSQVKRELFKLKVHRRPTFASSCYTSK